MNPIPLRRHLYFWVFVCAATFLDLYSKHVVFEQLGGPGNRGEWNASFLGGVFFEFLTTLNHGALWGVGQGFSLIFASLSLLAIGVILFWLFVKRHAHSLWLTTCLAMIMAGTLGNLYDRLGMHGIRNEAGELQHAVRDFLHFNLWGYEWATSLAAVYDAGEWGLIVNGIYGDNGSGRLGNLAANRQGNFWGLVVMPYYWIVEDKLQAVVRYQYQGAEESRGIRVNSRYTRADHGFPVNATIAGGRGNEHHALYGGVNWLLCGHNLKLQTGLEYEWLNAPGAGTEGDVAATTAWFGFRTCF